MNTSVKGCWRRSCQAGERAEDQRKDFWFLFKRIYGWLMCNNNNNSAAFFKLLPSNFEGGMRSDGCRQDFVNKNK